MKLKLVSLLIIFCLILIIGLQLKNLLANEKIIESYSENTITPTVFKPVQNTPTAEPIPGAVVLTGAGDISICGQDGDELTSVLLEEVPGYIFTLGDNQNDEGEYDRFTRCFEASWGKYKDRMIPTIGNHEYFTEGAAGYFDYFGDKAGEYGKGYYSTDIGAWHIVVINSICYEDGRCEYDSEMLQWLEEDLSNDTHLCTMAMWHIPRFSSGYHGDDELVDPIWRTVVSHDVELVLNGHEHNYERFSPMDENGDIDLAGGTRQIISGTGGASLRVLGENVKTASEVFDSSNYGVLQLVLEYGTYTWEFISIDENGFSDSGKGYCH